MKKEKRNRRSHELIREMIELYHPQSIKDIQEMLKDMFADTMEDMLKAAEEKGEPPFLILLDGIEDPHNLGAIIRTANLAGAPGVIIPKRRAVGLTATVAKTSAGA